MTKFSVLACAIALCACSATNKDERKDGADAGADGDSDADIDGGGDSDTDGDADGDSDGDGDGDGDYDGPPIPTTCEQAAEARNSVGCEFFAADLDNNALIDGATYAIVVSNPQLDEDANVWIEDLRDDGKLRIIPELDDKLGPGELRVFNVSCNAGCPVRDTNGLNLTGPKIHIARTGFKAASAFRVKSDVPILAYQWNTHGKQMNTTDASLLLPVTALDKEYIAATWGFGHEEEAPADEQSEVVVIAVEDGTEVTITPSVDVRAADQGKPGAISAGQPSNPIAMNAFDVLQVSPADLHADLTGTRVVANEKVVVFGAHPCANVPAAEWFACDHLEEQMLPLGAWGHDAVLARYPARPNVKPEKDQPIWRIVAGTDDMTVTFDPPVDGLGATHSFFAAGEVLEFQSPVDHYVSGALNNPPDPSKPEAPLFAYQLMTGRFWVSDQVGVMDYEWGDPFMALAPPAGQYLPRYVFATDNVFDFEIDAVIIVRKAGYAVTVDCLGELPDDEFTQVGSSEWEVGRFFIDTIGGVDGCEDGAHRAESEAPFGLTVVGEDYALSVGYPGGIGVNWINPVLAPV